MSVLRRAALVLVFTMMTAVLSSGAARGQPQDDLARSIPVEAAVKFRDDFDSAALSADWTVWDRPPLLSGGQMLLIGRRAWSDAVVRSGIEAHEGVILRFRYDTGTIEFFLDFGEYQTEAYRNLRLAAYGSDTWQIYTASGAYGARRFTFASAQLTPGRWYTLLARLGEEGHFFVQVWDAETTDRYAINAEIVPPGEGWIGQTWWFGGKVFDGALSIDAYAELQFPPDYAMPCSVTTGQNSNLRQGPGIEFSLAGRLYPGSHRRVEGQVMGRDGQTWWRLASDAWVRSDVVEEYGACASLPILSE